MSSSQNTVELLPAAIEAVKLSFRIGILVSEIRNQIEQGGENNPSWSAVVSGIQESDATSILDKFHTEKVSFYQARKGHNLTSFSSTHQHLAERTLAHQAQALLLSVGHI